MLKFILVSILFFGVVYAASASASCDSCGDECAASCGTRRFRACCFNYLRRKRGPDTDALWTSERGVDYSIPIVYLKHSPRNKEHWIDILASGTL